MENVVISCNTKDEYYKTLKKLEKLGYTWMSGDPPTYTNGMGYWNEYTQHKDIYATDNKIALYKMLSDTTKYKEISADEFIGNKPIVIYRVGRTVVAYDQNTDRNAVAKCHPNDKFDFYVGAKLAFSRLTGCNFVEQFDEAGSDMSKTTGQIKFKVGDTVKLKSGLVVGEQYYGSSCSVTFLDTMDTDKPMIIKSISPAGNYRCDNNYYYAPSMIEKYNEFAVDKFKVGDKVTLRMDLVVGNVYGGLTLLNGKMSHFGEVLTITNLKGNIPTLYQCDNGYTYTEEMLINPRNVLTIGSKIKVTDLGKAFRTYHEWVDKNVIESRDKVRYDYGATLKEHVTGTVITIAPHLRYKNTKLVYFEYNGKCYLFDINGVERA